MRYATQRVPSDRNEATFDGSHIGECRRHQNRLIDRTAHRRNPAHLVYRWAYDGKVEPFSAPDIAVKDFPDVQTEIHVGYWLALRTAAFFQLGNTLACSDCSGKCRVACVRAIFGSKDGKRAVADQLEYI